MDSFLGGIGIYIFYQDVDYVFFSLEGVRLSYDEEQMMMGANAVCSEPNFTIKGGEGESG